MRWVVRFGSLLGGKERAQAMLAGQGVSFILKSINVNFRRPVTFPDTVCVFFNLMEPSENDTYVS